jgi:hypothetical protein
MVCFAANYVRDGIFLPQDTMAGPNHARIKRHPLTVPSARDFYQYSTTSPISSPPGEAFPS